MAEWPKVEIVATLRLDPEELEKTGDLTQAVQNVLGPSGLEIIGAWQNTRP